jgi:iodotyrosine deiodinase
MCVTVAEVADGDEYDEDDGQNPDLTSALPWDLQHVPLEFKRLPVEETIRRSTEFYNCMSTRRTVRFFSSDPVPADVIRNIIRAAGRLLKNC